LSENIVGIISLLFSYFIIALIFESAMSVIFKWRVYLRKWNHKGKKTLILVIAASILTFSLDLNIFEKLMPLLSETGEPYEGGKVLLYEHIVTAFFIAGGSGGIYEVMKKTALRDEEKSTLITKNSELEVSASDLVDSLLDITKGKVSLKKSISVSQGDHKELEKKAKTIRDLLDT